MGFSTFSVKPRVTQLVIDGKLINSVSGKTFDTFYPATEEKITSIQEADAQDVDKAVKAARKAFDEGPWRRMSAYDRGQLMFKFADLIEKNVKELGELETMDVGKPITHSVGRDMVKVIRTLRYYAGWADKIHGKTIPISSPHMLYTREEPVGVCALIIPWNFPAQLLAWKLGPMLATGCTAVVKPAEQTPLTALRLAELALEAGIPNGVINVVPGFGPTAGASLVQHPLVDKVAFTGSTEVGFEIMRSAHKHNLKRITLELGGKSAHIVMDDADMDIAIASTHLGLFANAGQCCNSGSRIFVHEKIHDKFVERMVERVKKMIVGDPLDSKTEYGPQVDKVQMDKILSYVESGKKEGAKLLIGGSRLGNKGFFVQPSVFANVNDEMTIAKEEIFGPVMPILKFNNVDEVIKRANNTSYGLAAGVVTQNGETAIKLSNALRAGTVYVNCYHASTESTPFGGYKNSGLGRELGEAGLRSYLESKTVIIKRPDDSLP